MGGCSTKTAKAAASGAAKQEAPAEKRKAEKKGVPPMVPLLSVVFASALNNYEYKPKDMVQVDESGTQLPLHLLLGITNEGQMKFLERIDFIRWTREEDTTWDGDSKYTAAAACGFSGGWVYNEKYDRSKYQKAIGWVDERWGRVEKHEGFGLTGVTGYGECAKAHLLFVVFYSFFLSDIEEVIRNWLKTYKGGLYESYSVCEVVLVDDLFADMRDCVSWADVFISHAGKSHEVTRFTQ